MTDATTRRPSAVDPHSLAGERPDEESAGARVRAARTPRRLSRCGVCVWVTALTGASFSGCADDMGSQAATDTHAGVTTTDTTGTEDTTSTSGAMETTGGGETITTGGPETTGTSGSTGTTGTTGTTSATTETTETTDATETTDTSTTGGTGVDAVCGDGVAEGKEACDGDDLAGASCISEGFYSGALACDVDCLLDTAACSFDLDAPALQLEFAPIKRFDFSWSEVPGADVYRLYERASANEPYVQLGADLQKTTVSHEMPLHFRVDASYKLEACNNDVCVESQPVSVSDPLVDAIGYMKATDAGSPDNFGRSVTLSADGMTMAVGAPLEDSDAVGINGDEFNDLGENSGATFIFVRTASGAWSKQAYIKPSNTPASVRFGESVALSADGHTLAVGASMERSAGVGINGDQSDAGLVRAGAVYVFTRDDKDVWTQQAYIKASNTDAWDEFGQAIDLSADGDTLAVGAENEDSAATTINGDQLDNSAPSAGAVYMFRRSGADWSQEAYIKASNAESADYFGFALALSDDGDSLAVGAAREDGSASGINGVKDNAGDSVGAVYVFERDGDSQWSEAAYIKASNADNKDGFGGGVALSGDGETLVVGAGQESSGAVGINGDQLDNASAWSGAVYVFTRAGKGPWSQQAYIKAANADAMDYFGCRSVTTTTPMELSANGDVLAVAAIEEDGGSPGVNGDPLDNSEMDTGAVYVFVRDEFGEWSQRAYVKGIDPDAGDSYGRAVALDATGDILAVGASGEDGSGGPKADPYSNFVAASGAVFLY